MLLNIRGNCLHLEAKTGHMVGHLPLRKRARDFQTTRDTHKLLSYQGFSLWVPLIILL
ncbi:hypothetical protein [Ktedonosporobacter rubrisoli]|uniref:hypothetical protein n=1 Tax=Ktedonosporobacter rubrisoli TaxID=2509675 RepID=UPI0013EE50B6|nr:hypothetical protein [Ktedonosporobacter rubrisoli]